jgi:hypothetical protein
MTMLKTPTNPFTIINRNREVNIKRAEFEINLAQGLKRNAPKTAEMFERLPLPLKEAALSSTAPLAPLNWVRSPKKTIPEQSTLLRQFAAAVKIAGTRAHATTVGILDLGARVSELPRLIERMNKAQDRMVFIEVQTPVPAGMMKTGATVVAEFERAVNRPLRDDEKQDVVRNMPVNDFLTFAESVQQKNELDLLVGITPAMLAFHEDNEFFWNYFSYGNDGPLSVVSTFGLRAYAARAGRPFEAAVGLLIVGQLISNRNNLDFHEDNRGCPLDFNEDRESLVESIRAMRFDAACLNELVARDPDEAKSARELMSSLRRMRGVTK